MQDVGFDYGGKGGKDNQIIDVYFHHHFPKAVSPLLNTACSLTCASNSHPRHSHLVKSPLGGAQYCYSMKDHRLLATFVLEATPHAVLSYADQHVQSHAS